MRGGRLHRSDPLPESLPNTPGFSSNLHSPLGFFFPLGIEAFNPIWFRANSPSGYARSPFAPRRRSFKGLGCGSTFQVRYVSVSLLFFKPLGTFYIMRLERDSVKRIMRFSCQFPQLNGCAFCYRY